MSVAVVRDDHVIEAIAGGNTTAATGSNPPESKVRGGDEPVKSVMSVRSFDPELTVSRPGLPLKLPKKMGPGLLPTSKIVGFRSLKNPPPTPGISQTWFDRLSLTGRSPGRRR